MEKIIKQVAEWEYFRKLPEEIHGFKLINELMTCGSQYRIFTYSSSSLRRSFSIMYDSATKDFLGRTVIGLAEFFDISFIMQSLEGLESVLSERLEPTIKSMAYFDLGGLCSQITAKKVTEWQYSGKLPREISGFELFISPQEPVRMLNGSYVIIDYSDFETESNLTINYNIFRDEFFGEIRLKRTPIMTAGFDAKTLPDLATRLDSNLALTLEDLRLKL